MSYIRGSGKSVLLLAKHFNKNYSDYDGTKEALDEDGAVEPYSWFDMLVLVAIVFAANGYGIYKGSLASIAKECGFGSSAGYKGDLFERVATSLGRLIKRGGEDRVRLVGEPGCSDSPSQKMEWVYETNQEKVSSRFVSISPEEFGALREIGDAKGGSLETAFKVYMTIKFHMGSTYGSSVGKFSKGQGGWVSRKRLAEMSEVGADTVMKYIAAFVQKEMIGYYPGCGDNESIFTSGVDLDLYEAVEARQVKWHNTHHGGSKYGHFTASYRAGTPKTFCR